MLRKLNTRVSACQIQWNQFDNSAKFIDTNDSNDKKLSISTMLTIHTNWIDKIQNQKKVGYQNKRITIFIIWTIAVIVVIKIAHNTPITLINKTLQ